MFWVLSEMKDDKKSIQEIRTRDSLINFLYVCLSFREDKIDVIPKV